MSNILKSELAKNFTSLFAGNTVAQMLGILIYPIITRIYDVEEFGVLNTFLSIGGLMVICSGLEIQNSILLPKTNREAAACFHGGSLVVAIGIIMLFPICFIIKKFSWFGSASLGNYIYLLPVFVFSMALWQLLNIWYTRQKCFKEISSYQMVTSSSNAILKTSWHFLYLPFNGLIFSSVISPLLSVLLSIISSAKKLKELKFFDFRLMKEMMIKYRMFPVFSFPRTLVSYFSSNLPILFLSAYFDMTQIGLLGTALTLSFRPINMISTSFYQVFFQKCSTSVNNGEPIRPFLVLFVKRAFLAIIPLFILIAVVVPYVIPVLLGESWVETGRYIIYLLPWIAVSSIAAPISFLPDLFSAQRNALFFEIIILIFRFIGLLVGVCMDNFALAVLLYSLANVVILLAQIVWYITLAKK